VAITHPNVPWDHCPELSEHSFLVAKVHLGQLGPVVVGCGYSAILVINLGDTGFVGDLKGMYWSRQKLQP
jgi:hypothetical protein